LKKIISLFLVICLSANIAFAFDPYAGTEEEADKKSPIQLIYGIVLTLTGAFLTYDGFSKVEYDVSKPSVDYLTVIHGEWNQLGAGEAQFEYTISSGTTTWLATAPANTIINNAVYNKGNVDLTNVKIEVRYFKSDNTPVVVESGEYATDDNGYRTIKIVSIAKNEYETWQDIFKYIAASAQMPAEGKPRTPDAVDSEHGLYLGEDTLKIMQVRIDLSGCYTKIYEKRNKSDLEGVAGIVIAGAGIYFLADYFIGLKKFDRYMKQNQMNIMLASCPSEYKLLFQKRI